MKMGDPCHGYLVLLHSVKPDWRSDEDPEVVKLTRTLDAFQHFVLQNSEEGLIITDLQGILHW